jgi:hypothetical protein
MRLAYLGFLCLVAVVCYSKPLNNFDVLPYTVTVGVCNGQTFEQAQAHAYELVKRRVTTAEYHLLTDGDSTYRTTLQRDAVAMGEQIPFYSVKSGYITALRFFPDPVIGTRILAVLGYLLMGIMVWLLLAEILSGWKLLAASALIMLTPAALEPARLATPDTLGCAFMLTALYAGCRNHWIAAMGSAVVALWFRPDAVIFAVLLLGVAWWHNESRVAVAIMASLTLVSYFVTTLGAYNWTTLFQHSFVGWITYPTDVVIRFKLSTYLVRLVRGFLSPQVSGLAAYLILLPWALKSSRWRWGLGLLATYSVLHYIAQPATDLRFFMAPCLMLAIAAVTSWQQPAANLDLLPARATRKLLNGRVRLRREKTQTGVL